MVLKTRISLEHLLGFSTIETLSGFAATINEDSDNPGTRAGNHDDTV